MMGRRVERPIFIPPGFVVKRAQHSRLDAALRAVLGDRGQLQQVIMNLVASRL